MADCSMAAADCKGSADYASYGFGHDNEEQGREYFKRLEENVSRLRSAVYSLDYANKKIKEHGADSTES